MEKRTPHYLLSAIQAQMTGIEAMNITFTAQAGIRAAGMAMGDALDVVRGLTQANFYKSMTTHKDIACGRTCITPSGAGRRST